MRQFYWLALLFLSACHHQNSKPNIVVDPIRVKEWHMTGKMSFSDGQNGGSGTINWSEINGQVHATFKAPLGQGSWVLDEPKGKITNSKGQTWSGSDISSLLAQQLGWEVPWESLKQSIKGVREGGPIFSDNDNQTFTRDGWQIEWKNIKQVDGLWLPNKIYLKKPPYAVKISVKSWQW